MKIPKDLLPEFPETRTSGQQCVHFLSICGNCGARFDGLSLKCKRCGKSRTRCANARMLSEDSCRVHSRARTYSLYTVVTSQASDTAFQDLLEMDDTSTAQEFQLARLALIQAVDKPKDQKPSSQELLDMIERFFRIAEKRKKIEEGEFLNIRMDDETMAELRKQASRMAIALKEVLVEFVESESTRIRILSAVRDKLQLKGNAKTVPKLKSRGKTWYKNRQNEDSDKSSESGS